jgi:hypothetical protein
VVPSSSSDNNLPLVRHDAGVDLNSGGVRICYTFESALVSDSPPQSLLPYIVSGQRIRVGHGKVLIPNLEYKGKGSRPHRARHRGCGVLLLQRCTVCLERWRSSTEEEEKEELSNELVASLKQKITSLEEQITKLHLAVCDQQDDFGVLRKATMSKLKHFAKALGNPSLCNAPSP